MKKLFLLAFGLICMQLAFAQSWNARVVASTDKEIVVEINVDGFVSNNVTTPAGDASVITNRKMMNMAQAGEPDVPSAVIPVVVGDDALMSVEVIESQYVDYENMEIAPSRGHFPRSINPDDVPYTYGAMYQQDAFYPAQIAQLHEPYIHRDVRGQNMVVTPYIYNPVTKVLRVYSHLVIKMQNIGKDTRNIIENRSKTLFVDREFKKMYESRYINYAESMSKYTSIADDGELLIICHDAFMTAMEPFVTWKKQIGRPTTIVSTNTTGTSGDAIKSYIANFYASNPNLTSVLLVGDVAQIPGLYISAGSGSSGYSGYGDMQYGQTAGNDYYNELIVGRFCCETEDQVTNHVNKVLNYERDLDETATWLTTGQGVSTTSQAGHYGESDYQHIDNIRTDLLNYNYDNVYRDYQNVTGTTATNAAAVSQHINEGVSIINYCNHGYVTGWGVFSYSNSHVNALTNDYKLPYIISVACLNGKYDNGSPCFAEAWMRATNNSNGNPTGAIGGMFSYISQPWTPPQYGQDEMVDILVESYSDNIRRTMGGVSVNGNMKVLDQGANSNPVKGTYNTWILYGDPTLTLRNAVPSIMGVTAANYISVTSTSLTVSATDGDGAIATLTRDGEIMGSATIENGSATITFDAPSTTGTATLTVFGYNKKTYITNIDITNGTPPTPDPVTVNVAVATPVIPLGESTQLSAIAQGGDGTYTYSWSPAASLNDPDIANPTATPSNTTTYTCTVTSAGLSASQTCTVTVVKAPTNLTATVINTNSVRLNWTAANPATNYTVYRNNATVATAITNTMWTDTNLTPGEYSYQVVTNYNGVVSPVSNTAEATIFAPLTVTASANPEEIERGETTTLNCNYSGGSGTYTITWTPSSSVASPHAATTVATPTETTTYTVAVTDGSNTASASVTVVVNEPQPVVCPTPENFYGEYYWDNFEFGVKLEWDRADYEYTLDRFEIYRSLDDNTYTMIKRIVNTPSITHYGCVDDEFDEIGKYYYQIIAFYQNDCQSEPLTIVVDVTSTGDISAGEVTLYPNPTSGNVNIKAESMRQVSVINAMGQVLMTQNIDNDEYKIDLSQFGNGIYLINITTEKGTIVRKVNVLR